MLFRVPILSLDSSLSTNSQRLRRATDTRSSGHLKPAIRAGQPKLESIAKSIGDLDDLLKLMRRTVPRAKPWQRQLAAHLAEIEQLIDVLRLTVAMEVTVRRTPPGTRGGQESSDEPQSHVEHPVRPTRGFVEGGDAGVRVHAWMARGQRPSPLVWHRRRGEVRLGLGRTRRHRLRSSHGARVVGGLER